MGSSRENVISVLDRDLLLVEVGTGGPRRTSLPPPRGEVAKAAHQGNDPEPSEGRWDVSCGTGGTKAAA